MELGSEVNFDSRLICNKCLKMSKIMFKHLLESERQRADNFVVTWEMKYADMMFLDYLEMYLKNLRSKIELTICEFLKALLILKKYIEKPDSSQCYVYSSSVFILFVTAVIIAHKISNDCRINNTCFSDENFPPLNLQTINEYETKLLIILNYDFGNEKEYEDLESELLSF
jgi:hypothetical protein